MRTGSGLIVFAFLSLSVFAGTPDQAAVEHRRARALMANAQQTTNPIRLLMLGFDIKESLDKALRLDPGNVQVRLDLVRFHVTSPRIVGGDEDEARAQAAEIAKHDAPLGAFARGYIAYKAKKEYGPARRELREAVRTAKEPSTKALAMQWLGWLSQETQQWDEAFAMFEELRDSYEIGRTAAFCTCQVERGRAALQEYLRGKTLAHAAEAKRLLAKLRPAAPSSGAPRADAKPR